MSTHQSLLKRARIEKLGNGRFQLFQSEDSSKPVSDIEFNNRKAARNWGRSRGYLIFDVAPDGTTLNGPN